MSRKHRQDQASETVSDASRNGASAADIPAAPEARSGDGGGGLGRLLLLLILAGLLAVVLSSELRSKLLDLLFGAEEEFDYSSTTMPADDAVSSVGASAS